MQFASKRYQVIELAINTNPMPGANKTTTFLPQQQLQSYQDGQIVFIHKIVCYPDTAISFSPLSSGLRVATNALIQQAALTLVAVGNQRYDGVPLSDLVNVQTDPANFTPFNWNGFLTRDLYTTDWTKSYVRTLTDLSGETPFCFLFGIHYSYRADPELDSDTIRYGLNWTSNGN